MRNLKPLDAANRERALEWRRISSNNAQPNGISCPACGAELFDTSPNITLTSSPPQKDIACLAENCGYRGFRIA